jgi:hypothetical protein
LQKLTAQYGQVASADVLMQDFYALQQSKGERIQTFAARLEGAIEQIRLRYPDLVLEKDRDAHLRDRLFYGMHKNLRDSIRFMYENAEIKFQQLMLAARRAESESIDRKVLPKVAKATVVDRDSSLDELKHQMTQLMSAVTLGPQTQKKGGARNTNNNSGKRSNGEQSKPKEEGVQRQTEDFANLEKFKKKNWQRETRCFKCSGFGHISRFCSSRLNGMKGEKKKETTSPEKKKIVVSTPASSQPSGRNSPVLP